MLLSLLCSDFRSSFLWVALRFCGSERQASLTNLTNRFSLKMEGQILKQHLNTCPSLPSAYLS